MSLSPNKLWGASLALIKNNVSEQQYNAWFKPLVFSSFREETGDLVVKAPSSFISDYIDENFGSLMISALRHYFGRDIVFSWNVMVDKEHKISQVVESDPSDNVVVARPQTRANQSPTVLDAAVPQELDPHLNPHLTFNSFVEGDSNRLSRSVGLSIAEHPNTTKFNPLFIFGPSGCGKTHLINAIGVRAKQLYPQKRVLYVSARLFQVQYTDAELKGKVNDFINFYQTIDMLIVDDIQEWAEAKKTQNTFFHIFNHLFLNGKRIILACDRPPVELKGMPERLITRFSCGLIAELEKPNVELFMDILKSKIRRDGLNIPADVVSYIANTTNDSVRELQGAVNSLLAYSVVYNTNIDMNLAERVMRRAVKTDNHPLTVDEIVETVSRHYNVTPDSINSRSRKRDFVMARQVAMYLVQKYTKMPASRIGRLVGGRDHSTVIHSCSLVESRMKSERDFLKEIESIESSFRIKQ